MWCSELLAASCCCFPILGESLAVCVHLPLFQQKISALVSLSAPFGKYGVDEFPSLSLTCFWGYICGSRELSCLSSTVNFLSVLLNDATDHSARRELAVNSLVSMLVLTVRSNLASLAQTGACSIICAPSSCIRPTCFWFTCLHPKGQSIPLNHSSLQRGAVFHDECLMTGM